MEEDNVDNLLRRIEQKYSSDCCSVASPSKTSEVSFNSDLKNQIRILSQEMDTLGLPTVNPEHSPPDLLNSILSSTFLLIHLYRKTLVGVTDGNITLKKKDVKINELEKHISNLKVKLKKQEDEKIKMESKCSKTVSENEVLRKTVSSHNKETDKMKHYFKSKVNELTHQIRALENENQHLKEICGKDIDKYFNKEDKYLQILKKYRNNEEVYKSALQKLEENNTEILNEILNLKRELALAYLK